MGSAPSQWAAFGEVTNREAGTGILFSADVSFHKEMTLCPCVFLLTSRVVVLESRPTENPTANSNLYILAGHENSY